MKAAVMLKGGGMYFLFQIYHCINVSVSFCFINLSGEGKSRGWGSVPVSFLTSPGIQDGEQ